MKKRYIITPIFVLVCLFLYLNASFKMFEKEITYYGKVKDNSGQVSKMVSENDEVKYNYKIKDASNRGITSKDYVKVKLTDSGGVLISASKIKKSEIPRNVMKKL